MKSRQEEITDIITTAYQQRDAAKLALWPELVTALSAIADAHDHLWAVVNDEDECGHHYRAVQNDQSCERASALLAEARKLQ